MFRYLARLQQAPLSERRRAAFMFSTILFILFLIVWFGITSFRSLFFSSEEEQAPRAVNGIVAPY